jgi:hypothetical protein
MNLLHSSGAIDFVVFRYTLLYAPRRIFRKTSTTSATPIIHIGGEHWQIGGLSAVWLAIEDLTSPDTGIKRQAIERLQLLNAPRFFRLLPIFCSH